MMMMIRKTRHEHWSAELIRIDNLAVRDAQQHNRRLGVPNWYSLNGRLVSDAPVDETQPAKSQQAR